MTEIATQETSREFQSKEAYLASFEKEWRLIHKGNAPQIGLKEKGRSERKSVCEDVKLKNSEKGIFLVADGVSSFRGWFASRETARVVYETLGERLDRAIENNIKEARSRGEHPLDRITQYVAAQMSVAVEQAHTRIKAMAANPEFRGSATTLSLAKLVELPDENSRMIQRLFFTNVGDSRIYIERKRGTLEQITHDDSMLELQVKSGELTEMQAQEIDQAPDPNRLNPKLRGYARQRTIITKSIGLGELKGSAGVFYLDLHPGDRLVIVSDGVSDQFLTKQIQDRLRRQPDDDKAEEAIQQECMDISLAGVDPRAKGDDISALVYTVLQHGPDREYLRSESKAAQTHESLSAAIVGFRLKRETAAQEVRRIQGEIGHLDTMTPKRERLALMIRQEKARETQAAAAYHLEKTKLDLFDLRIGPRFEAGEQVHVWREDFDPPSLDRQMWTVVGYDPHSKHYALRGAGGTSRKVSRYAIESVQSGLMVRLGDGLQRLDETGEREMGFNVIGFDRDGTVVMAKEDRTTIKRMRVKAQDANDAFFNELFMAEQSLKRMEQAVQAYYQAAESVRSYQDELSLIEQIERRQQAITRAKEKG